MPSTQSASIAAIIGWTPPHEYDRSQECYWCGHVEVNGPDILGVVCLDSEAMPTADDLLAWLRRKVSMFDPIEIVAFGKLVRVSLRDGRRHQLVADGSTVLEALEAAVRGVQSRLAP
jgi:hypothetical protein